MGVNHQGIVAGHRNAPDEVQELGEVELPITVQIQFLHHPVHNTRVLLILQKTKESLNLCLPLTKPLQCQRTGIGGGRQNPARPTHAALAPGGSELIPLPTMVLRGFNCHPRGWSTGCRSLLWPCSPL